jgi:hypothetical protein
MKPAYGRVYSDVESLMKDFDEGKDFTTVVNMDGTAKSAYSSKREMISYGFTLFYLYFNWKYNSPYYVYNAATNEGILVAHS